MTNYCDTTKLSIRQVDKPTAKKMIVKYHYSKLWTKCSVALGLFIDTGNEHAFFDEAEEKLIGVCVYGDPIGRLTGQSISDEIKRTEVLELTRLFIYDGYGSNIESWFISQSFNWLRKNKSEMLPPDSLPTGSPNTHTPISRSSISSKNECCLPV